MPRDTPYSGVAAIFRSSLEPGQAPRVFEDGGQMRDFVHVDDVARANVPRPRRRGGPRGRVVVDVQRLLRAPRCRSAGSPRCSARRPAARHPVVTGDYRPGDVRHVVARPELAAQELGFRAQVTPEAGVKEFADGAACGERTTWSTGR